MGCVSDFVRLGHNYFVLVLKVNHSAPINSLNAQYYTVPILITDHFDTTTDNSGYYVCFQT